MPDIMTLHLLNFDPRILHNISIKLHNIQNDKMHSQYAYQQNIMMMNQQQNPNSFMQYPNNSQFGFNSNGNGVENAENENDTGNDLFI
jgi:hypothetical protein